MPHFFKDTSNSDKLDALKTSEGHKKIPDANALIRAIWAIEHRYKDISTDNGEPDLHTDNLTEVEPSVVRDVEQEVEPSQIPRHG